MLRRSLGTLLAWRRTTAVCNAPTLAVFSRCAAPPSSSGAAVTRNSAGSHFSYSRRFASNQAGGDGGADSTQFEYDPMASVRRDAAVTAAQQSVTSIVESLLPAEAPPAVVEKVKQYVAQHPIDGLIVADNVQITHVENPDTGAEEKVSLSPVPLAEALSQASLRGMNLVQMGMRGDTSFCRIRTEKPRIDKLVEADMLEYAELQQQQQHSSQRGGGRALPLVDHVFRDAVDAHFIGWKSKKICDDIKKGHPVKLTIKEFQTAESAMNKLREMSNAIRRHAEGANVYHHFTSIVGNDREASITMSPATANKSGTFSKTVKHPSDKEWGSAIQRMQGACKKSGRAGTYAKSAALKPRNVGGTMYRTDKYGRRVD